ncbi:DUF429 domain-containing protein [Quadrisphaera setariae]|uniref:DUF429 domain-containing protein n=1 Tax=Quadrisphaera setariae TaxID=2593304 RepID=A0A5C8ZFC0_9ACTN|nr:DUF429 domain-containing protein [Quadrisphaera setariae]TXR55500.1 DUF429 domain-containing protein [Quadrisphaera setariae]
MTAQRFLGIDLAWGVHTAARPARETALVLLDDHGRVLDAGWCRGVEAVVSWVDDRVEGEDVLAFVDAPLVVDNPTGQRTCEKQVGQRYWRSQVFANSTSLTSPHDAGLRLRAALEERGWRYDAGWNGPAASGRVISECYPYTAIVGVDELGYEERPRYKRKPRSVRSSEWSQLRAQECDELIRRVAALVDAPVPLDLASHPVTASLVDAPSPTAEGPYKHREDLLDAAICAWTAAYWHRFGLERCQVLGDALGTSGSATIIAPAKPGQRPLEPSLAGV